MSMNEVCKTTHIRVDERLNSHDATLGNHDGRIVNLEKLQSKSEVQIDNLCKQINNLVKAMWGFLTIFASSLVGFFIWFVQNK